MLERENDSIVDELFWLERPVNLEEVTGGMK
jgi:hypothetical protein